MESKVLLRKVGKGNKMGQEASLTKAGATIEPGTADVYLIPSHTGNRCITKTT